MRLKILKSL